MSPLLDVQSLSKRFGERILFENIDFSIAEGEKVGLIARNGTGKSTLLAILAGEETPDTGSIVWRNGVTVGFLPQKPQFLPDDTVLDACFNHENKEEKILRAKQILTNLQIRDLSQRMGTLSGGQQKRVALANVLINEPQLLILDEPTNHLDLQMIEWLEGFLSRPGRALLMVTHDRYFLDRVCSRILELDDRQIFSYKGSYSFYLAKRQERIDVQNATQMRAANLYRRELEWMRRQPQARGHKARYREEAFYELEQVAKRRREEKSISLTNTNTYIGSKIFECQYVSKSFGKDCVILRDFYYNFARYEKLGIVGANGAGKSTFVRLLLGEETPDSGRFDVGSTVQFGYFSQSPLPLRKEQRVIDAVRDVAEYVTLGQGRKLTAGALLERFLFTRAQQYDFIEKLSGGEMRKLQLCLVLMRQPNFLVLDEPTNDLDIQTLQILEEYLAEFPGCVIVVSHDRYFTDKVVDHLLVFHGDGVIQDFPGNYTQYREWKRLQPRPATEKARTAPAAQKSASPADATAPQKRRLSFKEKRELEQLETAIAALEAEKADIVRALSEGKIPVDDIVRLSKRLPELEADMEEKTLRWMELEDLRA